MVKLDAVFTAADSLTPEFAANLSECAVSFDAQVSLECSGKQLQLDSLICILSMELYRGVKVSVIAEGAEAEKAAEAVRRILVGE